MTEPTRPCDTCGMPCTPGEYHPYAACLMFKACHNSETVRANLGVVRVTPPAVVGEPVFAFRRKGLNDFCTCTEDRYEELSAKPSLFETRIFYTTPQPTQAQAEVPCRKNPFYHGPRTCIRGTVGCCEDHGAKRQVQAVVPAGYALVPIEPTPEMLSAMWVPPNSSLADTYSSLSDAYNAMLAAAPQPVVREPLTDGQIRAMAREHPAEDLCGWSCLRGVADAERHHGITGGQHD